MRRTILMALLLSAPIFGQQQSTAAPPRCPNSSCAPIVVDTTGHGLVFTDPKKGKYVSFDITGSGTLVKLSWPKVGSGNAWLVYDRDGMVSSKMGRSSLGISRRTLMVQTQTGLEKSGRTKRIPSASVVRSSGAGRRWQSDHRQERQDLE